MSNHLHMAFLGCSLSEDPFGKFSLQTQSPCCDTPKSHGRPHTMLPQLSQFSLFFIHPSPGTRSIHKEANLGVVPRARTLLAPRLKSCQQRPRRHGVENNHPHGALSKSTLTDCVSIIKQLLTAVPLSLGCIVTQQR